MFNSSGILDLFNLLNYIDVLIINNIKDYE